MMHLIRTFRPLGHCPRAFHTENKAPNQNPYFQLLQRVFEFKYSHPPFYRDPDQVATIPILPHNWRGREIGNWKNELNPFKNAISQGIEETVSKYDPECASTLEIGSGRYSIIPFLPNARNKDQIHLSDINTLCLHSLRKTYPKNTIRRVDLLAPNQTSRTYQTILMSDVLNIFSPDELSKALKSIHQLLEPGGLLLHFSVREPIFTSTLDTLRMNRENYLPIINEHSLWDGVYVIDRNRFIDFIFAQKTDLVTKVLLEYMSLGSLLQSDLNIELLARPELQLFFDLSESIKKFEGLVTRTILFEKEYLDTLREELNKRNFTVLEFDERECKYDGPKREEQHKMWPNHNVFRINKMFQVCRKDCKIPEGQVLENAFVHVLVAQK